MSHIELIFPDDLDEKEVSRMLRNHGSGFHTDDRRSLESAVVDGFTIAGVIIDTLSLATAVWSLRNQLNEKATPRKTAPKEIRVRRTPNDAAEALPTQDVTAIVNALEEMTK
jgi:hypothetical protein